MSGKTYTICDDCPNDNESLFPPASFLPHKSPGGENPHQVGVEASRIRYSRDLTQYLDTGAIHLCYATVHVSFEVKSDKIDYMVSCCSCMKMECTAN